MKSINGLINRNPEYKGVSEFLKNYEKIIEQKTEAYFMTKEELKKEYNIDYNKFKL